MNERTKDIKVYLSFEVVEHLTPKEKIRRKRAAKAKRLLGYLALFFFIQAIFLSYYAFHRLNAALYVVSGVIMFISLLSLAGRCIADFVCEHPNLEDDGIEWGNDPYHNLCR